MHVFEMDGVASYMILAIPIVAISGGILAGVIRTISAHRLLEAAVRERMALVARGVDPGRLAGSSAAGPLARESGLVGLARYRAQGLLVSGFVTFAGGASFAVVSRALDSLMDDNWVLGVIAASAGLALIAGGLILWPRGGHATARANS
jgi:hypothetical protein